MSVEATVFLDDSADRGTGERVEPGAARHCHWEQPAAVPLLGHSECWHQGRGMATRRPWRDTVAGILGHSGYQGRGVRQEQRQAVLGHGADDDASRRSALARGG